MSRGPAGMRWLVLLVLPSALGLLGFGLAGLLGNARDLRREVAEEARVAAGVEARALRQALDSPALLEKLPEDSRFIARADGTILCPPELGTLDAELLQAPRPAFLAPETRAALDRAAALEFEAGDRAGALALLEAALGDARDEEDIGALATRLAWCASRAGRGELRDRAIDRVLGLDGPAEADGLAAVLLAIASGRDLGAVFAAALAKYAEADALLLVARLRDLAPEPAAAIERELRRLMARRARLREAQLRLARRDAGEGLTEAIGDLLLVVRPRAALLSDQAGFVGAIVEPRLLVAAAGFDPERFVYGPVEQDEAIPAIPLVAALPQRFAARDAAAEFGFTAILLVGIAAAFVVGLLLAARGLRREALAARARSEFLTSVTHELKTPLASIRLIAEMLDEGLVRSPEKRDEYHRLLSGEAARLTMLIENVLDLGRMERGERAYDRREESPVAVVRDAVELFRPVARRDGLGIETRLGQDGVRALIDRGALVQALLNLLENARKYAFAGGRIELDDEIDGRVYRLRLRDFGPGIPADELESVFDRFRRGSAQADGRIAGVGLGLHLARRIVEDHGGRLFARVPEDDRGGALFVLEMPVALAEEER